MAFNIFRSARLAYVPIEDNEEHVEALRKIRGSPTFWNGDLGLPIPAGKDNTIAYRDILKKHCSLALMICFVEEVPTTVQEVNNNAQNHMQQISEEKERLVSIGDLTLSTGGPESQRHHNGGSVGIELLPAYHGKGYGTEALKWLQWYAFQISNLHRLELQAVSWNKGALRLYQKLGWQVEGTAREAIWFMGDWHDVISLGLLEHEWRAANDADKAQISREQKSDAVAQLMGCQ